MVGQGLGIEPEELGALIGQLSAVRLGKLKPQARPDAADNWRTRLFGSRTLHSARIAKLQPWARTVIWKDPHAIMMVPDLVGGDVDVVVTARTPWAHAASYKRLGCAPMRRNLSPLVEQFAPATLRAFLGQARPVISALLWRMLTCR